VGVLYCAVHAWKISFLVFKTLSFGLYLLNSYLFLEKRICLYFQDQAAKKTVYHLTWHYNPGKLERLISCCSIPCHVRIVMETTDLPIIEYGAFFPSYSSDKVVGI